MFTTAETDGTGSFAGRPKLSILILTYNRQLMLVQCLDSVLLTTVDCEIVIFDDASTDGTPEVLRAYADRDPRIRYFRQPSNVGGAANFDAARNLDAEHTPETVA